MEQYKDTVSILASLLHDIGKVWTRADGARAHGTAGAQALRGARGLLPQAWQEQVWDAVEGHHARADTRLRRLVRAADRLASGELAKPGTGAPSQVPLQPTLAQVSLGLGVPGGNWGYPLLPLSGDGPIFAQEDVEVSRSDYERIRDGLEADLERLAQRNSVNDLGAVTGLLSVLRRWTTYVPAFAGEADEEYSLASDISLYNHLRLTGALATCLTRKDDGELEALANRDPGAWANPVALMLRADISGIQNFIYRITSSRSDGTFSGAARRLRGRSLYLALLTDVIADWLLQRLELSALNVLFSGGGHLDLLLPLETQEQVEALEQELQQWLLTAFHGELGIQLVTAPLRPSDLSDMQEVTGALDDALGRAKQRKFEMFVRGSGDLASGFHLPHDQRYHACNVCHLTPRADPGICEMCELHAELGRKLPKTTHVAFVWGDAAGRLPETSLEAAISFGSPFRTTVALLNQDEADEFVRLSRARPGKAALYRLNDTDCVPSGASANLALGFRFLSTRAPLDRYDNVLDFDGIAEQSQGANLLGVLKADVDRLGFIFTAGIRPTLARVLMLSESMDLYFGGRLGLLCQQVAANTFYVVYAGGDDLLILGPWDRIVELVLRLHLDFRKYACVNENITLSAGVLLTKPHFPIHRFAQLVSDALEKAKNKGRNRVTAFTQTVVWETQAEAGGYDQLLDFGRRLAEKVEKQELRKGFVYFLKRLHDAHFDQDGEENPMWIPKFHYTVARQVDKQVIHDLDLLTNTLDMMEHIQVPVSYVSLKTRKE